MTNEPVLAETVVFIDDKQYNIKAKGGLHFIKSNGKPYFTVTFEQRALGARRIEAGGADTDFIVKHFPHLADLAALHLSDIDGLPMHAQANGWYWLAGVVGGLGQQFHGGNGSSPTEPAKCADILKAHLRLDDAELAALIQTANERKDDPKGLRVLFDAFVEALKPRWEIEAAACRAKHKLEVFGDAYPAA